MLICKFFKACCLQFCIDMKTSHDDSRRAFIKTGSLLALGGLLVPSFGRMKDTVVPGTDAQGSDIRFDLPPLPYAYNALEPWIDEETMKLHHDKHHAAYVENLNKALKNESKASPDLETLLKTVSKYPTIVRNNAGGHYNHSMFWKLMKPNGGGLPSGALAEAINNSFGSFDVFKTKFNEAATKQFGSGWAWLVKRKQKLEIGATPNQDNPLMDIAGFKGTPILGLDVWEHAYYLKYQNKRPDYIQAWWNVVNWDEASKNFANAK
jgi:Fe-Mn family superoxide dismutase